MVYLSNVEKILRNPAFGLIPMLIFSVLILFTDTCIATMIALVLSIVGYIAVKKCSRLIYDISIITFGIASVLLFTTFLKLPVVNRLVIVEIIFVLSLITMRLSRVKIITQVGKRGNLMLKNYVKESFRVSFQTQYGLSIHLLLVLGIFLFGASELHFATSVVLVILCQVILLGIFVIETARLYILDKKLYKEEWLPVVTERGEVTGKVAKSISIDLKNKFMHPVVRLAFIYKGRIYLRTREKERLLNPGKLDFPFEKYMQFNDNVDETLQNGIRKECGCNDIPLRFLLKYTFENEITKRLIFLYVSVIEEEATFNCLRLQGGKLWTSSQIEDNLGTDIFSECFELEYEYLKNTVLMAYQIKNENE